MTPTRHAMTPKLRAADLAFRVDGDPIVRDVDLSVSTGETLVVVGPSGAGKSTLLRLFNRLDEPTSGTVYLDGTDYREFAPADLRSRVGMVPQEPAPWRRTSGSARGSGGSQWTRPASWTCSTASA